MTHWLAHDLLDASKVWAAAFLGWSMTASSLDAILKVCIAVATLAYMVGKAVLVWRQIVAKKKDKTTNDEKDI